MTGNPPGYEHSDDAGPSLTRSTDPNQDHDLEEAGDSGDESGLLADDPLEAEGQPQSVSFDVYAREDY